MELKSEFQQILNQKMDGYEPSHFQTECVEIDSTLYENAVDPSQLDAFCPSARTTFHSTPYSVFIKKPKKNEESEDGQVKRFSKKIPVISLSELPESLSRRLETLAKKESFRSVGLPLPKFSMDQFRKFKRQILKVIHPDLGGDPSSFHPIFTELKEIEQACLDILDLRRSH